jgi:hypothetical protein
MSTQECCNLTINAREDRAHFTGREEPVVDSGENMKRRKFLGIGLAGLGATAKRPWLALAGETSADHFCLMMGNH